MTFGKLQSSLTDNISLNSSEMKSSQQVTLLKVLFEKASILDCSFTFYVKTENFKDTASLIDIVGTTFRFYPTIATATLVNQIKCQQAENEYLGMTIQRYEIPYSMNHIGYRLRLWNNKDEYDQTETCHFSQVQSVIEKLIESNIKITWTLKREVREKVWSAMFVDGVIFRVVPPKMSKDLQVMLSNLKVHDYVISNIRKCLEHNDQIDGSSFDWVIEACGNARVVHDIQFQRSKCTLVTPKDIFDNFIKFEYDFEVIGHRYE